MAERLVYVDTSALMKLLFAEAESAAVRQFVGSAAANGTVLVASEWIAVELFCAADMRSDGDPTLRRDARSVLSVVNQLRLDRSTLLASAELPYRLPAGDAVHMATAIRAGADEVLVFDTRLEAAVRASGRAVLHGVQQASG
jgi:predicted nucleic acid-binding protein